MGHRLDDTASGVACLQATMATARADQHELFLAVARVENDGTAIAAGYRSTKRFLQDVLRINAAEAGHLLDRAHDLTPRAAMTGEPLPPPLPATSTASAAGVLGDGHLTVIATTLQRLTRIPGIDPDAVDDAEQALVHYARQLAPAGLARVAHRIVANLNPDGAAPDEPPEPDDELHLLRRRDGSLALKGQVLGVADAEAIVEVFDALSTPAGPDDPRTQPQRFAAVLKELVAQATSPTGIATDTRRDDPVDDQPTLDDPDSDDPDSDDPDSDDPDDAEPDDAETGEAAGDDRREVQATDLDQRETNAADALAERPRSASSQRSTGCPTITVNGRALLAVTIDHRWLQAQIGHGLLDSDRAADPATARRLACDAGIVPMILGSRSEPLDVGRLSYTVPEGMRRALHHRDGGCSFPGCTRRPKRCHAHHLRHWIDGGETELNNLTLLCVFHHHLIHHGDWVVTMIDGRPWYQPPTWVDPHRTLRPGGRFPVPHTA